MTVRVDIFDYDGCLSGWKECTPAQLLANQSNLVKYLRAQQAKFEHHEIMIGTNRQSIDKELINIMRNQNGSAFAFFRELAKAIECPLDPFLMADLENDRFPGHHFAKFFELATKLNIDVTQLFSFDAIIPFTSEANACYGQTFDEDKLTMLYAMMHKKAVENSETSVEIHFWDDKDCDKYPRTRGILDKLAKMDKALIPSNVSLVLHHYRMKVIAPSGNRTEKEIVPAHTELETLVGKGELDSNYEQTVKDMFAIARRKEPAKVDSFSEHGFCTANYINAQAIEDYRAEKQAARDLIAQAKAGTLLCFKPLNVKTLSDDASVSSTPVAGHP